MLRVAWAWWLKVWRSLGVVAGVGAALQVLSSCPDGGFWCICGLEAC